MKTPRATARAAGNRERAGQAASVLDVVELAYCVDLPDSIWRGQLLRSVQELVRCDLGGFICSWERSSSGGVSVRSPILAGIAEKHADQIFAGMANAPSAWIQGVMRSVPSLGRCVLTSEIDPHGHLAYRAAFREYGCTDGVNLIARDLDDRGFLVSVAVKTRASFTHKLRGELTKAFTHVLAALRLRARLSARRTNSIEDSSGDPAAIFAPEGRLMHAHGAAKMASARLALARAVQTIERARAGGFGRPEEALSRWRGLVSARWSLVDTFERDGTRYVVARENRPDAAGPVGLTSTESLVVAYAARGLTTKETAYALGLSDSTIRVLMMRAVRRSGLKNRRALLDAWAERASPTGSAPAR